MAVRAWHILIVVIIIGLLVGLLVPLLNRPGGKRTRSRCLRNVKLIGLALKQYALDNDKVFAWDDIEPDQSYRCFGKLYPSYTSAAVYFTCPLSRDKPFKFNEDHEDGQLLDVKQCRRSLSYAYGHNRGKPWTEEAPSTTRIAADKYANADYSYGDLRSEPSNHGGDGRNVVHIDGSGKWDNTAGPLDADPDTELDESGDAKNDQTGPDWWSDPPEK